MTQERGLNLRALLLLGFGGIFALWMLSAWALVNGMTDADSRSLAIRTRFLHNEQLLSTVRAQALLSSVYLRDALLDRSASQGEFYREQLDQIRRQVEDSLSGYIPRAESSAEREHWIRLRDELRQYWESMIPVLDLGLGTDTAMSRAYLRDELIPRREAVIRISDRIHALNQDAFSDELGELALLRAGLRSRIWQSSLIAVSLGVIVALVAARAARRLELRIRDQHAEAIRHREELERLSSKLLLVQEEERRRIARELHDEVGQALSALKLELAVIGRAPGAPEAALAEARAIADRTLQSVRDLSQLLHPAMLDDLGLPETADWYLRAFARRTGIPTELVVDRLDQRLAPAVEVCTYRVIQEAMTNIARHAEARSCRVHIARNDDALRIVVQDDGKGFVGGQVGAAGERGLGLVGVRERVAGLGGALHVESGTGLGTTLTIVLPLPA